MAECGAHHAGQGLWAHAQDDAQAFQRLRCLPRVALQPGQQRRNHRVHRAASTALEEDVEGGAGRLRHHPQKLL